MTPQPESAPARDVALARWNQAKPWVVIGLLLVAAALLLVVLAGRPQAGLLDPRAASPEGSRALAQLLRDQGVSITLAQSRDEADRSIASDATLLVTVPDLVAPDDLNRLLQQSGTAVLVAPTETTLAVAAPGLRQVGEARVTGRKPACALPAAVAAGEADAGGLTYEPVRSMPPGAGPTTLCYPADGEASLASIAGTAGVVVVIGTADPFTNDRLDESGNAALTMRLLGQQDHLVWYRPSLADASGGSSSLTELIPAGWKWAALQLAVGVGLLALWRARRLGPVVSEPLPVVVRAAEAVEGRGRLYHRVRARDRAADALRSAARSRLRPPLGLPEPAGRAALVDAVAGRTGRAAADVDAILYGVPPADEPGLVRLADELDALEREVRRQ
jgi:hypothetical protein